MLKTDSGSWFIHQIGTAVPEAVLNTAESVELFRPGGFDPRTFKLLARIARFTGVEKRHLAALEPQFAPGSPDALYRPSSEQPHGPGMGARSAVFEKVAGPLVLRSLSSFAPQRLAEIDTLVTASCTHASSPGLELAILSSTPVPASVNRWNLGFMGCSAALAAMRLVHGLSDRTRSCENPFSHDARRESLPATAVGEPRPLPARTHNALVVACELSSLHFQYSDQLDQITANLLFADGAASAILSTAPSRVRLIDCACRGLPQRADQMVWTADDHGLRLHLAQELPETLGQHVPAAVCDFLAQHELTPPDIDHWLVHPGGPQILDSVEAALNLPPRALDLSRDILRRYGNMSSPTILFILKDLLDSAASTTAASGRCVAMAFGPGLTIELALFGVDPA